MGARPSSKYEIEEEHEMSDANGWPNPPSVQAENADPKGLREMNLFAMTIAHEIRNPLYVIRNLAVTELERLKELRAHLWSKNIYGTVRILEKTVVQAERAFAIAKHLSKLAKSNNGIRIRLALSPLIDESLCNASHQMAGHRTLAIKHIASALPKLRANPCQIEEIFLNLMLNALQAMQGRGTLTIRAWSDGLRILISVRDTGPGIRKDIMASLFEPFKSTKGQESLGIGLYITKRLVEQNGGNITVRSALGKGTIVTLDFPIE